MTAQPKLKLARPRAHSGLSPQDTSAMSAAGSRDSARRKGPAGTRASRPPLNHISE